MTDETMEAVVEPTETEQEVTTEETVETQTEESQETPTEEAKTEEAATVSGEEEESEPSGPKKVGASERVQQAVNEKNEVKEQLEKTQKELDKLKAKFEESQAEKPDFIDIDHDKVNQHLKDLEAKAEDARLNGNIYEANLLEREKQSVIDDIKENESKKTEWEKGQEAKANNAQTVEQRLTELDNAAEFYRKEIGLESETWDKMGGLFAEELKQNKILGKKFADMVDRQGAVAAVEWAYTHTKENLVKPDPKPAKEEAKEKLVSVGGGSSTDTMPKTWAELSNMHSKKINEFYHNHPKVYQKLYDKHMAN